MLKSEVLKLFTFKKEKAKYRLIYKGYGCMLGTKKECINKAMTYSIEDLKLMHKNAKKRQLLTNYRYNKLFNYYFKADARLFLDKWLVCFGYNCFDIVKFDNYFKSKFWDYEKENLSLKEAIKKYNNKACKVLMAIL